MALCQKSVSAKSYRFCDALGLELSAQQKSKRPTLQQLIRENNHA